MVRRDRTVKLESQGPVESAGPSLNPCSRGDEAARLHDSNKENRDMKLVLTCALAMILVSTIPAEAQLCAGAPSFRDYPLQVGVSAAFRDDAKGVGGSFGAGGEALFATGGVSVLNFDGADSSQTSVSGTIGTDLQADDDGRVFLCPIGQVAFGAGPDFGPVDVSTITLSGGVSVGVIAYQTDMLTAIPTFGLFAVHNRVTAEAGGSDNTVSDASGLATVGVGLLFNRNVSVIPEVLVPFSAGNGDALFSIKLLYNFGR